ncbi:MAG: hypothetical protein MRY72_11360, partial [Aquisalinus sp.]|nr:hypothetical protein [Aquisalinus sp.]
DNGSGPDIDVDFDDLTIVSVSLNGEAFSAGEQIELSSGALLIVNQDGTFAYDTNGAFDALEFRQLQSETDAIEYTITDGFAFGTASIEITILGVNNNIINGTFRAETISGSGVGDDIFGRGGDDIINGGNGNDLLEGNGGRDEINGGDGNDELIGGDGGDRLFGGDGDDIISGRRGSDFIQAGAGNDDVAGRGLRDVIFGGSGDDTLRGNGGQDELFGEKGNDRLVGGQGNDFLFGGDDNDFLDGRAGDDVLNGGSGEDILRGSKGADTFIFEAGHEIADIVDFQNNEDLLDLTSYGFETLDEAISNMEQDGFDVIFAVGSDRLTVSSITVGELQDDILI